MLAHLLIVLLQVVAESSSQREKTGVLPALEQETAASALVQEGKEGKAIKILATGPWQYVRADPNGPREGQQLVLRSAKELANRPPFNMLDATAEVVEKMATAALAKAFKVDAIDWSKQMVVVVTAGVKPTGGYRVEIVKASVSDKVVTINWRLHTPKGAVTQAFTHPAQAALLERHEGKVVFVEGGAETKRTRPPDRSDSPADPAPASQEKAQESKELKILAQAPRRLGYPRGGGHQVIRPLQELVKAIKGTKEEKATAQLSELLKVDRIDWEKQMVIVVSGGTQRTGGYSVGVQRLTVKDNTLTVHWKLNTPKPGQPVTQALTTPSATILVERFNGPVVFDPPAGKSSLDERK
jgi:hypothetical protein